MSIWDIFDPIGDAANKVIPGIKEGTEAVGKGLGKAAETVAKTLKDVGDGDAFFPDNPKRESRVKELAADVSQISYRVASDRKIVEDSLDGLNQSVDDLFRRSGFEPPAIAAPHPVNINSMTYAISELVAPIVAVKAVGIAVADATVVGELEAGEIGAEAAGEALGAASLGMGPGAVVVAGVIAGIGAIEGSDRRDKLQDALRDNYKLRTRMKKTEIITQKLGLGIAGLSSAFKSVNKIYDSPDEISKMVKDKISSLVAVMKVSVDSSVSSQLSSLDNGRGSWTDEDT